MTDADEPRIDDHPDDGQEQYQRSPAEEQELDRIGEGEDEDVTQPSSDDPARAGADEAGPDGPAPLTSPTDDDRKRDVPSVDRQVEP